MIRIPKNLKKHIPMLLGKRLMFIHAYSKSRAHQQAFKLFCTPLRGKVLPEQEEFLTEAKDMVLQTQNLNIQTYRWEPKNSDEFKGTVLLIHGWDSNTYRWRHLIPTLLKKGFNIVALDAPAQGYSSGKLLNVPLYTECVQAMTKAYDIDYFIGHSLGGMTSIYHQFKYPNPQIKKLIVLGPPSELSRIMKGFQQTLQLSDAFMDSMNQYFKKKFGFYYREFSVARFASYVKQPGLVVHDRLDTIAPFAASQAIHKNWKSSTLIATEGLGHSLFDKSVNQSIVDYLQNTEVPMKPVKQS